MSLARQPEVISLDPQLLHDVIENIRLVGRATGAEERADEIAEGMETRVEAVRAALPTPTRSPACSMWSGPIP